MKISARNALKGKVTAVKAGAVNSEVDLTSVGGDKIVATVTNDSVTSLKLAIGREVTALVKASSVLVLVGGDEMKLSARNCLTGKVTRITEGPVHAEVSIALPGGDVVHATITHDAVSDLGLKVGMAASAVFKAGTVILAVKA